ncbi:hypothetical protein [Lentzea sp. NPDC051838]|uniref:hypothetical protein n=1 Tax=Lentzea sp. NPDC051838 TaxID=3154849 RepID=UPI00342430DC
MLRLLPVLLLLTGCSIFESFNPQINAIGKQIVADWKQRPDVAAAQFVYRHGLDAGDSLGLEVMLKAESITDPVVDEVVEIARKDCWLGTWDSCSATYTVYTTADPPYADKPESGKPVRSGKVDLPPELETSYGPRPTRPSK